MILIPLFLLMCLFFVIVFGIAFGWILIQLFKKMKEHHDNFDSGPELP